MKIDKLSKSDETPQVDDSPDVGVEDLSELRAKVLAIDRVYDLAIDPTGPAGPLQPMLPGESSPAALAAIRFAGGLLLFMAPTLYVTRWNKLNGKAGRGKTKLVVTQLTKDFYCYNC